MEYKYYRELKHNYLIFENKSKTENSDDNYQYRIIASGRIKGLIPCSERNINGGKFLYYEINSMQTLRDRFLARGMNHEQLTRLLKDIKKLLEEMSEFLLGDESVVFNAGNVYTDLATGEFKLMVCPFFDESKNFSEFAMEILELVDDKDERATDLAYRLCEKSTEHGDFIYEVIEDALKCEEALDEDKQEPIVRETSINNVNTDREDFYEDDIDDDEEDEPVKRNDRMRRSEKRLGGKLQLLMALLFTAVVAAMVYIRMNYILSGEENILSIIVMLVSAVSGVIALSGGVKELKKPKETTENKEDKTDDFDLVGSEEEFTEKDFWEEEEEEIKTRNFKATKKTADRYCGDDGDNMETIVLDEERKEGIALFSRNLDKTVRIALDSLPVTIGKMEGCVDKVIRDASISRIHCRFISENGRIAVIDLGSTNGTFRNGLKLKAQQKSFIDEGDEIRIGRVCFDCR